MPRRNGLEVCRMLKADPSTSHIKIVNVDGERQRRRSNARVRGVGGRLLRQTVQPDRPARQGVRAARLTAWLARCFELMESLLSPLGIGLAFVWSFAVLASVQLTVRLIMAFSVKRTFFAVSGVMAVTVPFSVAYLLVFGLLTDGHAGRDRVDRRSAGTWWPSACFGSAGQRSTVAAAIGIGLLSAPWGVLLIPPWGSGGRKYSASHGNTYFVAWGAPKGRTYRRGSPRSLRPPLPRRGIQKDAPRGAEQAYPDGGSDGAALLVEPKHALGHHVPADAGQHDRYWDGPSVSGQTPGGRRRSRVPSPP